MGRFWLLLRTAGVAAGVALAALLVPSPAKADRLLYGQLSWRATGTRSVQFTATVAFRRSGLVGSAADGWVGVGDVFQERLVFPFVNLDPGDGNLLLRGLNTRYRAIAIDPTTDVVVARILDPVTGSERIGYVYPAPFDPNTGGPWVARLFGRRVAGSINAGSQDVEIQTEVDLVRSGSSTATGTPPVLEVRPGTTFPIPAADAEGGQLRYRLSTAAEVGDPNFQQPPGLTVDPISGLCSVPAGLPIGTWAVQVSIDKLNNQGLQIGRTAVDFILRVPRTQTVGVEPFFASPPTPAPGAVVPARVGDNVAYTVLARDSQFELITLNSGGGPPGSSHGPVLPWTDSPSGTTFSWRPTAEDVGTHIVTYFARDASDNFIWTYVVVRVIRALRLLEPVGGESYLIGSPVRIAWNRQGITRPQGIRIELSRDGGASFPEVLAFAAPDTGSFSWVATGPYSPRCRIRLTNVGDPTDSDQSAEDFTITDGRSVQLCTARTSIPIPDDNPAWTEVPLNFTADMIIRGLQVKVDITHPYIGDLQVAVLHPDGTMVMLHDSTGGAQDNIVATYGAGLQFRRPAEPLSRLYGKRTRAFDAQGRAIPWKLLVRDLNPGDVGTVNEWCLTVLGPDTGTLTVEQPNGGELWAIGTRQAIRWSASRVAGNVRVDLSRDGGATWTTLAVLPASALRFDWTVTGPVTDQARVRVVSVNDPVVFDTSDGEFRIVNPFLTVIEPNGGETLSVGVATRIRWQCVPATSNVKIDFSRDGGRSWTNIAPSVPNTGEYEWTPEPGTATTQGRIRIATLSAPFLTDRSDRLFTVVEPSIRVISPNGGEVWPLGSRQTVSWQSFQVSGPVRIQLFRNGAWTELAASTANDGSETFTITGDPATDARVRVTSIADPSRFDESDAPFRIVRPAVTLLAPNGGEVWPIGLRRTIRWSSSGLPAKAGVDLELSRDGGATWETLFQGTPNDGAENWTVTGPASDRCLIRIRVSGTTAFDVSDRVFSIRQASVTVLAPNGGEELVVGQQVTLRWTSTAVTGNVKIELTRGGGVWTTLFASTANDGSEAWTVTGPDTATARIRISTLQPPIVSDVSDAAFRIVTPSLRVDSPNGGEVWLAGTRQTIRWTSVALSGSVRLELSTDNGGSWKPIAASAPNTGSFTLTVPNIPSEQCRVRIVSLAKPTVRDESDGPFTIVGRSIIVEAPNGGEEWLVGTRQTILWQSTGIEGAVNIDLVLPDGSRRRLFTATANDGAQEWLVPDTAVGTGRRILIFAVDAPSVQDASDGTFTISRPRLTVTEPQAGAVWQAGTRQTIRWTGNVVDAGGTVEVQLSRDGGTTFETLFSETDNDGEVGWLVSGPSTTRAVIRVIWRQNRSVFGDSAIFTIRQ